jgi:hypothetical protein
VTPHTLKHGLSSLAYALGRKYSGLQQRSVWRRIIQARWRDIEYFDAAWRARIRQMAEFIPPNATVMDLGCGPGWLCEIVDARNYTGVDYRPRSNDTVVCDFNKHQFPQFRRDVAFVSGCLEYIDDYCWFIAQICDQTDMCVLSYCPMETHQDVAVRRRVGWVNDLAVADIKREFERHGLRLHAEAETPTRNAILVFKREA